MAKFEDLTGKKFGYYTVVSRAANNSHGSARWNVVCECGNVKTVGAQGLKNGACKSCGCHKNDYNRTHGGNRTRLYEIWRHMRYRCDNKQNQAYENYGARGIKVCKEWYDFSKFRKWAMENGYKDSLSIDRIDNNGNYEPSNCRWAESETQMNNRRNTKHYEFKGRSMTITQWAREVGIPRSTILNRMEKGMPFEEAIMHQ